MLDFIETFCNKEWGFYRCQDPSLIKFRVSIEGVVGGETETRNVSWQDKIFSLAELDTYGKYSVLTCSLDRRFKSEVDKLLSSGERLQNLISTHIDQEETLKTFERDKQVLTEDVPLSRLARLINDKLHVHETPVEARDSSSVEKDAAATDAVVSRRARDQRLSNWSDHTGRHSVFSVVVTLGGREYELCRMRHDGSSTLSVYPDFMTNRSAPYRLNSDDGQRLVCKFWLLLTSQLTPTTTTTTTTKQQQKQHGDNNTAKSSSVVVYEGLSALPYGGVGKTSRVVVLHGEVVTASGFQRDNLFLHCLLQLPASWSCSEDTQLSSVSQLCRARPAAHFCFPLTGQLFWPADTQQNSHTDSSDGEDEKEEDSSGFSIRWPVLHIQVMSEDWLGVVRVEGCCHVTLPRRPGCRQLLLNTWRPLDGVSGELRRLFIGAAPYLNDPSLTSIPVWHEGSKLSRHSLTSVTSGRVEVRLNCIHQTAGGHSDPSSPVQQSGCDKAAVVLKAFTRARARMLEARNVAASMVSAYTVHERPRCQ